MSLIDVKICECCGQPVHSATVSKFNQHMKTIEDLYGMSLEDLQEKIRTPVFTQARQHLCFLLVIESNWSLKRTGDKLDRNHRSVASAVFNFADKHYGLGSHKILNDVRRAYWKKLGLSKKEIERRIPKHHINK